MERLIKIGSLPTGNKNNICDVKGVHVGHKTIINGTNRTGITAILPHSENLFYKKVTGGCYSYNGYGKSMGFIQVQELGTIETPILMTNTLSIGAVSDGLIKYMLEKTPSIGLTDGTVNPIVLECNDGSLNDIRNIVLTKDDVFDAINDAKDDFQEGDIGAGTGMICHGLKGGIGSSSRVFNIENQQYCLGVIVNSNFGSSRGKDLIVKGRHIGEQIFSGYKEEDDKGSITVVVATDLPVDSRQLVRIIKRCAIGIGRTGSFAGHGSGDVFVGFTTANIHSYPSQKAFHSINIIDDSYLNVAFRAVVECTEEAILNSLLFSKGCSGFQQNVSSLNSYRELFSDLLIGDKDEEI